MSPPAPAGCLSIALQGLSHSYLDLKISKYGISGVFLGTQRRLVNLSRSMKKKIPKSTFIILSQNTISYNFFLVVFLIDPIITNETRKSQDHF